MNDSPKIDPKPSNSTGPTPFRVRPEAFLIAGLVLASGYLTAFNATTIKIGHRVAWKHPNMWPFHPGTLSLAYFDIAMIGILLLAMAMAAAFLYLQWQRGFYSLRASLGLMVVTAAVLGILCSSSNDLLTNSISRNLLTIPLIFGGIALVFVPLHLFAKAVTHSPHSKSKLMDPP